jgi:hypothetical protein
MNKFEDILRDTVNELKPWVVQVFKDLASDDLRFIRME